MGERLKLLEHHVLRMENFDTLGMTPEEAAIIFVFRLNNPRRIRLARRYPETPEFTNAVARVIRAHRNGEGIEILDDVCGDKYYDPLCKACKKCEMQLRLPGLEHI